MKLHRADGIMDLQSVMDTKIMIVGLGSLGSLLASCLVYPWREIVLVEPETLSIENVERHLLGRSSIGRNKAEAVADFLIDKGIDPGKIVVEPGFVEQVLKKHTDVDLVLVAIDKRMSCLRINYWAQENNKPVLYGGVYPKGVGGHVFVIPDPNAICYQCAAIMMGSSDAKESVKKDINYDVSPEDLLNDDGDIKAVPALHASIANVAVQMAGVALDMIAGVDVPSQVLVSTNGWEPVIIVEGSHLSNVSCIITSQADMGLVPFWKLKRVDGKLALTVHKTNIPLELKKHVLCPTHTRESIALDDI